MDEKNYILKLYIYGNSPECDRAVKNLKEACKTYVSNGTCDIEIIDIKENPEIAEEEGLIAIPTLIKKSPLPVRRIIGDLNDHKEILDLLGLLDSKDKI